MGYGETLRPCVTNVLSAAKILNNKIFKKKGSIIMKTSYRILCRELVTDPKVLRFCDHEDEVFTSLIFYDATIIPWYNISNYGKIYSKRYDRLIKPQIDQFGYYRAHITIAPNTTYYTGVHKLVLMAFDPIVENDIYIPNHLNGKITDNYIGNLEWATVSENTRHALDNNIARVKCENNSRSVFTNDQVHYICSLMERGYSTSQILDTLKLPYGKERNRIAAIIRLIHRGQTYLDISKQYNIPGLQGRVTYPDEFAELVCQFLIDPNREFTIEEICDFLNIPLDDRKMFNNWVDDLLKGTTSTIVTNKYKGKMKRPKTLPKNHPYYQYYY